MARLVHHGRRIPLARSIVTAAVPVRWLAVAAVAAVAAMVAVLAVPVAAPSTLMEEKADMETGDLSQFTESNESNGTLAVDSTMRYEGRQAARAHYEGGGHNGYSRGVWALRWPTGVDVWFSAAFFLPSGFRAAMQEEVALMRWDNWPSHRAAGDHGGIVIWGSDKRARLKVGTYSGGEDVLVGPFDVPEGRWFHVEVHQRLSPRVGDALSEVYLDGSLIGRTSAANTAGRDIERLRIGIVAVGSGAQTNPLTLWFDRAQVADHRAGPGGTPAPPVTTAPATTVPATAAPAPPAERSRHGDDAADCGPFTSSSGCGAVAPWTYETARRAAMHRPLGSPGRWALP